VTEPYPAAPRAGAAGQLRRDRAPSAWEARLAAHPPVPRTSIATRSAAAPGTHAPRRLERLAGLRRRANHWGRDSHPRRGPVPRRHWDRVPPLHSIGHVTTGARSPADSCPERSPRSRCHWDLDCSHSRAGCFPTTCEPSPRIRHWDQDCSRPPARSFPATPAAGSPAPRRDRTPATGRQLSLPPPEATRRRRKAPGRQRRQAGGTSRWDAGDGAYATPLPEALAVAARIAGATPPRPGCLSRIRRISGSMATSSPAILTVP
jgi:hypothetical protein